MFALPLTALIAALTVNPMLFVGHWEMVRGHHDGRLAGASARSFHAGDAVEIDVPGRAFRLYGVTGPTGGHAVVVVPGSAHHTIDFYAPAKHTHVLVYASPRFAAPGVRAVVVVGSHRDADSRGTYVNIDGIEIVP